MMKKYPQSDSFALVRDCQGRYNGTVPKNQADFLPLSKDTINGLEELGFVLRRIQQRMTAEGFEIVDGQIRKVRS